MIACQNGHIHVLKQLIQANANVNLQAEVTKILFLLTISVKPVYIWYLSQNGWTALMVASDKGHVEVLEELLLADADVNARDNVCHTVHSNR